jgi:ATP-binding cassette subfamily B protein
MHNRMRRARAAFLMNSANSGITRLLYAVGYGAGLAIGVYLFRQGQVTIGTVYLIIYYLGTLAQPLEALRDQIGDFQKATASIGRVQELFGTPVNIHEDPRRQLPAGALGVEFEGVSFGYSDEPRMEVRGVRAEDSADSALTAQSSVLSDISFRLDAGKVLGVLGRTGSGKTTLTRLLFRLYDPDAGSIRLGDVDIRDAGLSDVRGRVGMVTQEVQLFNASVRDNLTLFNRRIADEAILRALREIGLLEWFESLPDGLDTMLGAAGGGLSAGQAQLLALTRVFLRDPGLVILDEASSRLDPLTERLLERATNRLFTNRTAILIAHRLGTVQRADDILILEQGRIVEYGQRAQLAANPDSRFAQLLRTGLEEVLA